MHSVTVWHKYKERHKDREHKTTHEILFDNFDNVSVIKSKQHIYVYPLKKHVTFNFDAKPFPKKDKELSILGRTWYKRCGNVIDKPVCESYSDEIYTPIF